MRNWLFGTISVAAVIAAAACNGAGGGNDASAANEQRNEAVSNVASGAGTAQDHAAVMKARHDHYEAMGRAMKGIGDQMKAGSPDVAAIQQHAAVISGYGPQILGWFPEGSGPESGRRTRAKAEIWSDATTFKAAVEQFQDASGQFNAAARSGDMSAIQGTLPALRQSCSNCHEKFRGPDNH